MVVSVMTDINRESRVVSYINKINRIDSNNVEKLIAYNNLISILSNQTCHNEFISLATRVLPIYCVLPDDVRRALDVQICSQRITCLFKKINMWDMQVLTEEVIALFEQEKGEGGSACAKNEELLAVIEAGSKTRVRTLEERIALCVAKNRKSDLTDLEAVVSFNNLHYITVFLKDYPPYRDVLVKRLNEAYSVLRESIKITLDTQVYGEELIKEFKEFDLDVKRDDDFVFIGGRNN